MTQGITTALQQAGHDVELIRFPFKFMPTNYLIDQMHYLNHLDFSQFTHHQPDKVISLQFPGYGINHPNHIVWLVHQHRAVYELYPQQNASEDLATLRQAVIEFDKHALRQPKQIFTISQRVSQRLRDFNGIDSTPLYQPPPNPESFYTAPDYGYILCPSRVEPLKRQILLIEAAQYTQTPIRFIIAGKGSDVTRCQERISSLGVADKVIMMGHFSDQEKPTLYARSLGVFFGPFDEDYGYITLEAQLSSKPVITCDDSGGPLEFVIEGKNGFICPPDPKVLAERFDWLYSHRHLAAQMGTQGKQDYQCQQINWEHIVDTLVNA